MLRPLPHNADAELAVLGAVLADERAAARVVPLLRPEHFFANDRAAVYAMVVGRRAAGLPADAVALAPAFDADETLGGREHLARLIGCAATPINAGEYAHLMLDLHRRRELIQIGDDLLARAYDTASTDLDGVRITELAQSALSGLNGIRPRGYDEPDAEVSQEPEPAPWPTGVNYPASLWAARPWLSELRNYATARTLDADLLVGACLARFAALLPKGTTMDTGVMSGQASLNLLVAAIGPSGRGKSCAIEAAEHIVPVPEDVDIAEGALGSGQGIAEAFMGDVCTHPDGPKRERTVERKQVRHNAFLWLDEGQTLTRLAQQANNTIMPTLRSAAMGALSAR